MTSGIHQCSLHSSSSASGSTACHKPQLARATFKMRAPKLEAPAVSDTTARAAAILLDGHLTGGVGLGGRGLLRCRGPGIGRGLFEGRTAGDASEAT